MRGKVIFGVVSVVVLSVLLAGFASAETLSLSVYIEAHNMTVSNNWDVKYDDISVSLVQLSVLKEYPKTPLNLALRGDKILEIIADGSSLGKMDLSFIQTSSDLPTKNTTVKTLYLDYPANNIKILFNEQEKLAVSNIADVLCNNNGACDNCVGETCKNHFENYLSCPTDCKSYSGDKVCNPVSDGKCDKDCLNGEDKKDCNKKRLINWGIIGGIVLVVFIVLIIVFVVRLRRNKILDIKKKETPQE